MSESITPTRDVDKLRQAALEGLGQARTQLEELVRIPSVSADSFDQQHVRDSAEYVANLMRDAGMPEVSILHVNDDSGNPGAPAVVARRPAPDGAPTVLLYAHHDVQPPGNPDDWDSPAFEPTERGGRLFGRGTADDKAAAVIHANTVRTLLSRWGSDEGVGITCFIEGEEEIGSPTFLNFLHTHRELLRADVIVVLDADNWTVDVPALTTSLRGMVDINVSVSTLGWAQHSGMYGGAVPDAIMALTITLARLWDDAGDVAVQGLHRGEAADLDYSNERLRQDTGLLDGVSPIGEGTILSRRWTKPSITIIGTDAPSIEKSSNTLHDRAQAKLSLRVAPGQDARAAFNAVREHLLSTVPFGAHIEVTAGELGPAWQGSTDSAVYEHARWALEQAWGGVTPVYQGMGGSIPFIAQFGEVFPDAVTLVTGIEDPDTRAHGANESLDLSVFERAAVAEVLLLHKLAEESR